VNRHSGAIAQHRTRNPSIRGVCGSMEFRVLRFAKPRNDDRQHAMIISPSHPAQQEHTLLAEHVPGPTTARLSGTGRPLEIERDRALHLGR